MSFKSLITSQLLKYSSKTTVAMCCVSIQQVKGTMQSGQTYTKSVYMCVLCFQRGIMVAHWCVVEPVASCRWASWVMGVATVVLSRAALASTPGCPSTCVSSTTTSTKARKLLLSSELPRSWSCPVLSPDEPALAFLLCLKAGQSMFSLCWLTCSLVYQLISSSALKL